MDEVMAEAIEKIRREEKELKPKGKVQQVIKKDVANILQAFCQGDARFAEAVMEKGMSLEGCLEHISESVKGNGVSDLTVYKLAAEYFVPEAEVDFIMEIRIEGAGHVADFDGRKPAESRKNGGAKKKTGTNVAEPSGRNVSEADYLTPEGKRKPRAKKKQEAEPEAGDGVMQFSMFDMLDLQERKAGR